MSQIRTVSWFVLLSCRACAAACQRVSARRAEPRRLRSDGRGRGQTTSDGPFDGGDDVLGEAAGEGHREISGAGRDRPADGEGGPPSDHKTIPPADIEERHRPAHDKNDDGGDHDWKDESCFAFHACLGAFALRYWATNQNCLACSTACLFPASI